MIDYEFRKKKQKLSIMLKATPPPPVNCVAFIFHSLTRELRKLTLGLWDNDSSMAAATPGHAAFWTLDDNVNYRNVFGVQFTAT